jgi:hypothetical protein
MFLQSPTLETSRQASFIAFTQKMYRYRPDASSGLCQLHGVNSRDQQMPHFMLSRKVLVPPGYAERSCLLVSYRLPLLPHCFVLCHEPSARTLASSGAELLSFFLAESERLAFECVGDSKGFMFIHSGSSIRKRANFHVHVFVVQQRWQKAWVYTVLAAKNIGLAVFKPIARAFRNFKTRPSPPF